ncbi:MAG: thiamine biosynthesis protein ThiS [Deltaproteobacteria bacterium]|nr:thiamine biosynthesis protein ThiS [Deltaproteobacteria bacterium]HCH64643.1 thiamine biosynthesis protein ThiS [Deltaproteobacteria bacterium]
MSQMPAQFEIVLNGAPKWVPVNTSVAQLLRSCGLDRAGVAVAVAGQGVPRTQHEQVQLEAGQRVEVVQAVGGG